FLKLFLFIVYPICNGQNINPDAGFVFNDKVVSRIDIFIEPLDLDAIFSNPALNTEYPARFTFNNGKEAETVDSVGFRLRGNTSRLSKKKSFKISFNSFVKGQKFHGLEKMNINGEHNDPSIIRSKLCWNICRDMNIPAARANHVELYINNEYYGIYINVEHIDEEYVNKRFGNNDGNLYKCLWPAPLTYLGDDQNLYKYSVNGRRGYELKINTETDDYSDLAHFIDVLNNTSDEELPCELEKVINVNSLIKAIAVDVFIGNWDGPLYNQNNFYLYKNAETGLFEFIPYDLDNTMGIDWYNIDWALRDIYNWSPQNEQRPLYTKIISNEKYKEEFSYYLKYLVDNIVRPDAFFIETDRIKDMISPVVIDDPYRSQDFEWTYEDFLQSYTGRLIDDHVTYGLKPYIITRINSIDLAIGIIDAAPIISKLIYPDGITGQPINIQSCIEDENVLAVANFFHFRRDNTEWDSINMTLILEDYNLFEAEIDAFFSGGILDYFISAEDINGNISTSPKCDYYTLIVKPYSDIQLVINEFMASNKNYVVDRFGQFDDWIEIYNQGDIPVSFQNIYITDNPDNPGKYCLKGNPIIEPGEFAVLWADSQEEQGVSHISFSINKSGEFLGLYEKSEKEYYLIDGDFFGNSESDMPLARITDGSGSFISSNFGTPGYSNSDYNKAIVLIKVNMSYQNEIGVFSPEYDSVDVKGNVNQWFGNLSNKEYDDDFVYSFAIIGIDPGQELEYKFGINHNPDNMELQGKDYRKYFVHGGWQLVEHWYNDENSSIGINTLSINNEIKIYPQPAKDKLFVEAGDDISEIVIYNMQGQKLKYISGLQEKRYNLDVSSLISGMYVIQLRMAGMVAVSKKFIKY
ncbi:CotH kinase family protein, partial [Bacteroidota bacterium]